MSSVQIDTHDMTSVARRFLPKGASQRAVAILASAFAEVMRTGEAVVCRVTPAVSQLFPGVSSLHVDRVHYLAVGASSQGHLGYVLRPRPEEIPEYITDEEDWIETLAMWELVGLVENFPTAPIQIEQTRMENPNVH